MAKRGTASTSEPQMVEVPTPLGLPASAATVQFGRPVPPQHQILLYSADEWESFIHEWAHSQGSRYDRVRRFAGSGDMGIDIAGFTDDKGLFGCWDNYQCKHYVDALRPADAAAEIAKILWYSFARKYLAPRHSYFVARGGAGSALRSSSRTRRRCASMF